MAGLMETENCKNRCRELGIVGFVNCMPNGFLSMSK